jgi:hypothetical protein
MAELHMLTTGSGFENPRGGRPTACTGSTLPATRCLPSIWQVTRRWSRDPARIASIGFLEGALLVAQRTRLIRRRQPDGSFVTHADLASLPDKP